VRVLPQSTPTLWSSSNEFNGGLRKPINASFHICMHVDGEYDSSVGFVCRVNTQPALFIMKETEFDTHKSSLSGS
jgi:hypothetical protein